MATSVFPGRFGLFRELSCVTLLCACMLFMQVGLGVGIGPLDFLSRTFGIEDDPGRQSWLVASYSLLVGTLVLPMGAFGDIYGHKKLVVIGYLWFALWSLISGISNYAKSDIFFDVCRGFQGMGPAMLLPNGVAVLARMYPAGSMRKYFAFCAFAAAAPNGFVVGAVFVNLFGQLSSYGWPMGYYVLAIVLFVAGGIGLWILPGEQELESIHTAYMVEQAAIKAKEQKEAAPSSPTSDEKKRPESESGAAPAAAASSQGMDADEGTLHGDVEKKPTSSAPSEEGAAPVKKFDFIGAFLGVAALILINVAWNQGGNVGWEHWYDTYFLLILGFVFGAAYVYSSFKIPEPLLPRDVWTLENGIVLSCVGLGWSSFGIWNYYSWRFWIVIRGETPLTAAAQSIPVSVTGCICAFATGWLLTRPWFGPGPLLLLSLVGYLIALILLSSMPAQQSYWFNSFWSWVIAPLGMDLSFPAASIIISESLPRHRQGQAGSLVNTVINYSVALGLGFAGTAERYIVQHFEEKGTYSQYQLNLKGFRTAFYVGTGLAALGSLLAALNLVFVRVRARRAAAASKV